MFSKIVWSKFGQTFHGCMTVEGRGQEEEFFTPFIFRSSRFHFISSESFRSQFSPLIFIRVSSKFRKEAKRFPFVFEIAFGLEFCKINQREFQFVLTNVTRCQVVLVFFLKNFRMREGAKRMIGTFKKTQFQAERSQHNSSTCLSPEHIPS